MPAERRLVLVGAGHAHLHLLRHADRLRACGYRVQLVSPRWFDYSGTASGIAAGARPVATGRVDVAALAARAGVEHHDTLVDAVDPRRRRIVLAEDPSGAGELAYDVCSLNVGSVGAEPDGLEVGDAVVRVKPLTALSTLDRRLSDRPGSRVIVVGGGATGVELAAHLAGRPDVAAVRLLHAGPRLAASLPPAASRRLQRVLGRHGVRVHLDATVLAVRDDGVELGDGTRLAHDLAVLATGLAAPPLASEPPLGGPAGIPVEATLEHTEHEALYAVGDCADFLPRRLPRIGVHGVRQGPVLLAALEARAAGAAPPVYRPQQQALAVLDLGDTGLAARGRWWWEGAAALRLKGVIDRRWLRDLQDPPGS